MSAMAEKKSKGDSFIRSAQKYSRGKLEIMADILKASIAGTKKTHVMHMTHLSHDQLLYYIEELEGKGLLERRVEERATLYQTTYKGKEFLEHFSDMYELLNNHPMPAVWQRYTSSGNTITHSTPTEIQNRW